MPLSSPEAAESVIPRECRPKPALASHTITIPAAQTLPALEATDRPPPRQPWFWENPVDMFGVTLGDERYFTIDLASGTFKQIKRIDFPR